jgi:hypothetical protein
MSLEHRLHNERRAKVAALVRQRDDSETWDMVTAAAVLVALAAAVVLIGLA